MIRVPAGTGDWLFLRLRGLSVCSLLGAGCRSASASCRAGREALGLGVGDADDAGVPELLHPRIETQRKERHNR